MENKKYERYEKEDLIDEIIEMQGEIERLNNIVNEAKSFLKSIGYDEETGRIWNDMNDDECTDLLKILEGGRE